MLTHKIRKEFLNPGEFVFASGGTQVHTILGSCIAITLWHPEYHIGGMCHFVLPSKPAHEPVNTNEPNGRYGDEAMQLFELSAKLHRTPLKRYTAKIFGGSDILHHSADNTKASIGTQNTEMAIYLLNKHKIPIALAHIGEGGSRKIIFDLDTGDVWVKHTTLDNGPVIPQGFS